MRASAAPEISANRLGGQRTSVAAKPTDQFVTVMLSVPALINNHQSGEMVRPDASASSARTIVTPATEFNSITAYQSINAALNR